MQFLYIVICAVALVILFRNRILGIVVSRLCSVYIHTYEISVLKFSFFPFQVHQLQVVGEKQSFYVKRLMIKTHILQFIKKFGRCKWMDLDCQEIRCILRHQVRSAKSGKANSTLRNGLTFLRFVDVLVQNVQFVLLMELRNEEQRVVVMRLDSMPVKYEEMGDQNIVCNSMIDGLKLQYGKPKTNWMVNDVASKEAGMDYDAFVAMVMPKLVVKLRFAAVGRKCLEMQVHGQIDKMTTINIANMTQVCEEYESFTHNTIEKEHPKERNANGFVKSNLGGFKCKAIIVDPILHKPLELTFNIPVEGYKSALHRTSMPVGAHTNVQGSRLEDITLNDIHMQRLGEKSTSTIFKLDSVQVNKARSPTNGIRQFVIVSDATINIHFAILSLKAIINSCYPKIVKQGTLTKKCESEMKVSFNKVKLNLFEPSPCAQETQMVELFCSSASYTKTAAEQDNTPILKATAEHAIMTLLPKQQCSYVLVMSHIKFHKATNQRITFERIVIKRKNAETYLSSNANAFSFDNGNITIYDDKSDQKIRRTKTEIVLQHASINICAHSEEHYHLCDDTKHLFNLHMLVQRWVQYIQPPKEMECTSKKEAILIAAVKKMDVVAIMSINSTINSTINSAQLTHTQSTVGDSLLATCDLAKLKWKVSSTSDADYGIPGNYSIATITLGKLIKNQKHDENMNNAQSIQMLSKKVKLNAYHQLRLSYLLQDVLNLANVLMDASKEMKSSTSSKKSATSQIIFYEILINEAIVKLPIVDLEQENKSLYIQQHNLAFRVEENGSADFSSPKQFKRLQSYDPMLKVEYLNHFSATKHRSVQYSSNEFRMVIGIEGVHCGREILHGNSMELVANLFFSAITIPCATLPILSKKLFGDARLCLSTISMELPMEFLTISKSILHLLQYSLASIELKQQNLESSSLSWWDKYRYSYHGRFGITLKNWKLGVILTAKGDKILLNLRKLYVVLGMNDIAAQLDDICLSIRKSKKQAGSGDIKLLEPFELLKLPQLAIAVHVKWLFRQKKHHYVHAYPSHLLSNCSAFDSFKATAIDIIFCIKLKHSITLETKEKDTVPIAEHMLVGLRWDILFELLQEVLLRVVESKSYAHIEPQNKNSTTLANLVREVEIQASTDIVQILAWEGSKSHKGILLMVNSMDFCAVVSSNHVADLKSFNGTRVERPIKALQFKICGLRGYLLPHRSNLQSDIKVLPYQKYFPFTSLLSKNFFVEANDLQYMQGFIQDPNSEECVFNEICRSRFELAYKDSQSPSENGNTSTVFAFEEIHNSLRPPISLDSSAESQDSRDKNLQNRLLCFWHGRKLNSISKFLAPDTNYADRDKPTVIHTLKLLWTLETRDEVFYMVNVVKEYTFIVREYLSWAYGSHDETSSMSSSETRSESREHQTSPRFQKAKATLLDMLQSGKLGSRPKSPRGRKNQNKFKKGLSLTDINSPSIPEKASSFRQKRDQFVQDQMTLSQVGIDLDGTRRNFSILNVQLNFRDEASRSSVVVGSEDVDLKWMQETSASEIITTVEIFFRKVKSYIAPTDVDIAAGVQWLNMNSGMKVSENSDSTNDGLLTQILVESDINCKYVSSHVFEEQEKDAPVESILESGAKFELEVPNLTFTLDRNQFYQLLSVVRHVLLAPPAKQVTIHRNSVIFDVSKLQQFGPVNSSKTSFANLISKAKPTKQKLLSVVEEAIRRNEAASFSKPYILKTIAYKFGHSTWKLHLSPEMAMVGMSNYNFCEVCVRGVDGEHAFYSNGSVNFTLLLEWIEVNNLRPGPSSIVFDDAVAVLKPQIVLHKLHKIAGNTSKGRRAELPTSQQVGMLSIRSESDSPVSVLGHRVAVYNVLDVSIFPGISYSIVIQLANDLYELVHRYFFLPENEDSDDESQELLFGKKTKQVQATTPSPTKYARSIAAVKSVVGTRKHQVANIIDDRVGSVNEDKVEHIIEKDVEEGPGKCDICYFKYIRTGKICLRINCNGFVVNLNKFDLDLPPFVRRGKLWTWEKCIQKFESHLKWYITKDTATTGLNLFRSKLFKRNGQRKSIDGTNSADEEDSPRHASVTNEQLLFGVYHVEKD